MNINYYLSVMFDTLHLLFPNQYVFLGFWFITVAGILWLLYMVINGGNTTKLIKLAAEYFEDKKASRDRDYNTLFRQIAYLDNELRDRNELIENLTNRLEESDKDREKMHQQISELQRKLKLYEES